MTLTEMSERRIPWLRNQVRDWSFNHSAHRTQEMPNESKPPPDPTPIVGSATDITPLTHASPKPTHERTAAEEAGAIDWEAIAASPAFKDLLRAKARFIIPAMCF